MDRTLDQAVKGNAKNLRDAIDNAGTGVDTAYVRDGHHQGTLFVWDGLDWAVLDIEGRADTVQRVARLAVVTLHDNRPEEIVLEDGVRYMQHRDEYADLGLNQAGIAFDFECGTGEWVIDADDLDGLREVYGDDLEVIWEQAE